MTLQDIPSTSRVMCFPPRIHFTPHSDTITFPPCVRIYTPSTHVKCMDAFHHILHPCVYV